MMLNVPINIIIKCMFEDFAEPVAFVRKIVYRLLFGVDVVALRMR